MKTLVLTDETYEKVIASASAKALLLAHFEYDLPEGDELHRLRRAAETPAVFDLMRARLEAVNDAAEDIRLQMHELIRTAHERGIGITPLARWSGYSVARIQQILGR